VGIVVRKSDIDAKLDVWVRLVRATREGIRRWYGDPKLARDVLAKYTKERDPERLQKTHEFFTKQAGFNEDLTVTEPGIQQILSFLGSTVLPAAKTASPKQIYDTRILDKIRQ